MAITNVEELARLASTSLASYSTITSGDSLENDLKNGAAQMAPIQAAGFAARYELLSQQPNVDFNGFSATVFRDRVTGQKVLAIRGTEFTNGLGQIVTDFVVADLLGIGATGFANLQGIELYRYWKKLTTVGGQVVQYSDDDIVKMFMMANATALEAGSLVLPSGTVAAIAAWARSESTFGPLLTALQQDRGVDAGVAGQAVIAAGESVDVTGHSLGGHLALMFARMFPSRTHEVVTLNAPTFFTHGDAFLSTMGFPPQPGSNITRLEADGDGVHLIGNVDPGTAINFAQENQPGPIDAYVANHSSVNGVDGLNLLTLMSKLDSQFTQDAAGLSGFVRAASNTAENSYEWALDGLRRALLGPGVAATPVSSGASDTNRIALYGNVKTLSESQAFQALAGHVRIRPTQSIDLSALARTDFGAIAALTTLSPFVLQPADSQGHSALATLWQSSAWNAQHQAWQQDQDLRAQRKPAENYTAEWLADRQLLVDAIVKRNLDNAQTQQVDLPRLGASEAYDFNWSDAYAVNNQLLVQSTTPTPGVLQRRLVAFGGDIDNVLTGSDEQLGDHLYAGGGNDTVRGLAGADWLEGNAGDDSLEGGAGDDTLWGGAGVDTLKGGAGVDFLKGGAGHDLYQFADDTWSADTIDDSDGDGEIRVQGLPVLTGANAKRVNATTDVWQTDDERVTYTKIAAGDNQQHLRITVYYDTDGDQQFDAAYGILVRDWQDGELGISLGTQVAPPPEDPHVFQGDFAKKIEGGLYKLDYRGNYEFDGVQANAQDMIRGTTEADSIYGGGGNDGLEGNDGADLIDGGAGDDVLFGGWGADTLNGGDGRDLIFGSAEGFLWHPRRIEYLPESVPARHLALTSTAVRVTPRQCVRQEGPTW